MTAATGLAVRNPTLGTPDRRPGSVRRSTHLDMIPLPAAEGITLVLRAGARDVLTAEDGTTTVLGSATVTAWLDATNTLLRLDADPDGPAVQRLVGLTPRKGFRRAVADATRHDPHAPLALLLDDIPIGALLAGYSHLRAGRVTGPPRNQTGDPAGMMRDLCSGWRSGGTMILSIEQGHGVPVPELGDAPSLERADDAYAVDPSEPLPLEALRRRRRIDLHRLDDGTIAIDAMFRDTYQAETMEGTLHEYVVHATATEDGRLATVHADPRVLPWNECPAAAERTTALIGFPLEELTRQVPEQLTSTSSCTHLNDLLRSFSCVPALSASLRRP